MSVMFNKFNSFVASLGNGVFDFSADTLKIMLTDTAPVATNTQYSDLSGSELAAGGGYTTGGLALSSVVWGQSGGVAKMTAANITLNATASVGPFRYAVLYDYTATNKDLIAWWDYGGDANLLSGDSFSIDFDATNGIFQLT